MGQPKTEREVLEVEVERLPAADEASGHGASSGVDPTETVKLLHRALGPVAAGFMVDLLDAATFAPIIGLAAGVPVGYYLARQLGLVRGAAWQMALVVGLYCGIPGTFGLPLGTLAGAYVRLRQALGSRDS